jgi:hypothetical protein
MSVRGKESARRGDFEVATQDDHVIIRKRVNRRVTWTVEVHADELPARRAAIAEY